MSRPLLSNTPTRNVASPGKNPATPVQPAPSNPIFELFSPSQVSSSRDPELRQAQQVVMKMHSTIDEKDEHIKSLERKISDMEMSSSLYADISFLESQERHLRKELEKTIRSLAVKRKQLEEIQASSIMDKGYALSMSQSSLALNEALTTNIRDASISQAPPEPSSPSQPPSHGVASPLHQQPPPPAPALQEEGDVFDDALEHHQHHNIDFEVSSEDDEEDDDLMPGGEPVVPALNGLVEEAGYLDEEEDVPPTNIPPSTTSTSTTSSSEDSNKEKPVSLQILDKDTTNREGSDAPPPDVPVVQRHEQLKRLYELREQYEPNAMFIITKSQNSNTVVYSANVDGGGNAVVDEPCVPFWIMFENPEVGDTGKHPREELNMIEKNTAYGVKYDKDSQNQPGWYTCSVASLSDRAFVVGKGSEGGWMAKSPVAGRSCELQHIHVQMADSWIPRVAYIDIYGVDLESGGLVHEKKVP